MMMKRQNLYSRRDSGDGPRYSGNSFKNGRGYQHKPAYRSTGRAQVGQGSVMGLSMPHGWQFVYIDLILR